MIKIGITDVVSLSSVFFYEMELLDHDQLALKSVLLSRQQVTTKTIPSLFLIVGWRVEK